MSKQSRLLLEAANLSTLFLDHAGTAFANLPGGPECQLGAVPVDSPEYRHWLTNQANSLQPIVPSSSAIRDTLHALVAQAQRSSLPRRAIDLRIAADGSPFLPDSLHLNLANPECESVQITAQGWTLQPNFEPRFRYAEQACPLPQPASGAGPLHQLFEQLLPIPSDARERCLCWLTAALKPTGPYPILILQGPAASGKTTTARLLRHTIDPSTTPLAPLPNTPRQIQALAAHNRILAFDHVTSISRRQSEALCTAQRPVILTAPSRLSLDPELASRAILVELPEIAPQQRRTEASLSARFHELHPQLIGALCTALATTLKHLPTIKLDALPRFADAAAWVSAAQPALGLPQSAILAALTPDRSAHPFTRAIERFMQTRSEWVGTATDLLNALAHEHAAPDSPTAVGMEMRRMRSAIVQASFRRTHRGNTRHIVLTRNRDKVSSPPRPPQPAAPKPAGQRPSFPAAPPSPHAALPNPHAKMRNSHGNREDLRAPAF